MPRLRLLIVLAASFALLVAAGRDGRVPAVEASTSRPHTDAGLDIVLSRSSSQGRLLALLSADGKRLAGLTPPCRCDVGIADMNPTWSADGKRVAFTRRSQVWVVEPGTGRNRRIAPTTSAEDRSPAWSADGRLAFVRTRPAETGYQDEIVATGPNLAGLRVIASPSRLGYRLPVWSPDGKLAYVAVSTRDGVGGVNELVLTTPGSSGRRILLTGANIDALHWSPDGREIVASVQPTRLDPSQIIAVDVSSGKARALTHLADFGSATVDPLWSPTGAAVLYTRIIRGAIFGEHGPRVAKVSRDGRQRRWLARNAYGLGWAPDGTEILYLAHYLDDGHPLTLSAMRPDGSGKRIVLELDREQDVLDLSPPSWRADTR